ncbi:hypothetical protein [Kitasatospora griseola]|uniref:hypothetical protein n=1 Tax=Kitasatospora griseola TaxID=2064 RepID=UPI003421F186
MQVEHPSRLPGYNTDTAHGAIADQLASQARRLDHVQARIVQLATALQKDLQRIVDGRDADEPTINGILHRTAPGFDLDLLAARRTELHRSLTSLIEVYETLPPFTAADRAKRAAAAAQTRSTAIAARTESRAAAAATPSVPPGTATAAPPPIAPSHPPR